MRDDQGIVGFVLLVVVGPIACAAWYLVGRDDGRNNVYNEAVKVGAAVRVVDQETGEVRVEWRVCE